MEPTTTAAVLGLLDAYMPATALAAGLELGLFHALAERAHTAAEVAERFGIPPNRCGRWLDYLAALGLLRRTEQGYQVSAVGRAAILDGYRQDTWALLAQEARERYPAGLDLAHRLRHSGSVWQAQDLTPPDYVAQMTADPGRARRFTRMLYELHRPLAADLAGSLDMGGVRRLLDLGGGSGVVSLALLSRYPDLSAVVVDIPNVCAAGREIAAETAVAGRITYFPADFLRDDLPYGFDLVLECDVGIYTDALFDRLFEALLPGGHVVIVDDLSSGSGSPPYGPSPGRLGHAFWMSLRDPDFAPPAAEGVEALLAAKGFAVLPRRTLSGGETIMRAARA